MQNSKRRALASRRSVLFGSWEDEGISLDRHDFRSAEAHDWSEAFQADSLQVCVNFTGSGAIRPASEWVLSILPQTVVRHSLGKNRLKAERQADQHHRFLTLKMSRGWLTKIFQGHEEGVCREARDFLSGSTARNCTADLPLGAELRGIGEQLEAPPTGRAAAALWYQAKMLEIVSHTLLLPSDELFCQRQQRLAWERTECVKKALARDLEHPPTLIELGREAGCSAAYLSRTFAEQAGMTITRYLRNLRLERAAELLRSGDYNVTEAAMEVGYASLSHFSKAFAEKYGACPCVFGLPTALSIEGVEKKRRGA